MENNTRSVFEPLLPHGPGDRRKWGRLYGSSFGLVLANTAARHDGLVLVVTTDSTHARRLEEELSFFNSGAGALPLWHFPDWETLPYDRFSPYQDIVSERLSVLASLPSASKGLLVVPAQTLMGRISPTGYVEGHALSMAVGERLALDAMRLRLERAGYRCVAQVLEHGEFAVRGSLLDLFPMGSDTPYRIELFDDEIESIRTFDPESQRSTDKVEAINLLPAREFPIDEEAIRGFRQRYREAFEGDPQQSIVYRDVSNGQAPPGIEYYLPLFFDQTATLFDYLPDNTLVVAVEQIEAAAEEFWSECRERFELNRFDNEHPPLAPAQLFLDVPELFTRLNRYPRVDMQHFQHPEGHGVDYATEAPTNLTFDAKAERPTAALERFLGEFDGRVLFAAESPGRREALLDILRGRNIRPEAVESWGQFSSGRCKLGVLVAPLQHALLVDEPQLAIITETQLFGEHVLQQRRRQRSRTVDADAVVRNLAELQVGAPVVHIDHGVGRYLGLQILSTGGIEQEYLTLEYSGGDKLYVPVSSLDLISRYTGTAPESAPLHKLGSGQWEKAKRKAREKVRDVAAELLDIYARREARQGHAYPWDARQYALFAKAFPFEETPDQEDAIEAVLSDMRQGKPMDRLVCGDVGFGKTEVAMRAAFVAAMGGKQTAVLVPTTLLAEQHFQNFRDRFADWPVRVESLSRFRAKKDQDQVIRGLQEGNIDIVIGTHKLLQPGIKFNRLGLVIIDEEHRFGVRQKEQFKALRSEVDVLTLTATPIPRTLNMALGNLRELSVIATPPAKRLAVKTFVSEWNKGLLREACLREIKRGGQIYFLHNEVESIERIAREVEELVPEAIVRTAHGQMPERQLERAMSDFYHQRFNVLVCTTIIETGIDVPTANTIIINRADRFGLAQLYQLRGRVGRSHHRAYAYLFIPPRRTLTGDAQKRLEAIESIEELGTGFTLATHDLEIRGAGELLGDEQSGQMHEVGFSLYSEMLERAVEALKSGRVLDLEQPLHHGAEIDIGAPALIPDDYLPDVHGRLILYKRISSAGSKDALRELQVEMIDRFGLLPQPVKNLFAISELKLLATPLGIKKVELGPNGGRIGFEEQPPIDPMRIIELIQTKPKIYQLQGRDKLRISREMGDAQQRIEFAHELFEHLGKN